MVDDNIIWSTAASIGFGGLLLFGVQAAVCGFGYHLTYDEAKKHGRLIGNTIMTVAGCALVVGVLGFGTGGGSTCDDRDPISGQCFESQESTAPPQSGSQRAGDMLRMMALLSIGAWFGVRNGRSAYRAGKRAAAVNAPTTVQTVPVGPPR